MADCVTGAAADGLELGEAGFLPHPASRSEAVRIIPMDVVFIKR
jgi:hypothetical protein